MSFLGFNSSLRVSYSNIKPEELNGTREEEALFSGGIPTPFFAMTGSIWAVSAAGVSWMLGCKKGDIPFAFHSSPGYTQTMLPLPFRR